MRAPSKLVRVETVVGLVFLLLTLMFLVELRVYLRSGVWLLHGGVGAFRRWPMIETLNLTVGLHALGMLAWMGVVTHQLLTRGAGAHKTVGRLGAGGWSWRCCCPCPRCSGPSFRSSTAPRA